MFYCLDIIGVISHTYQYFALPTPHSVADEESDIKNIFKINFPDSLEVNAVVKESQNPGSILPPLQSFLCCCLQWRQKLLLNLERWSYALVHGGMAVTPPPPIQKFKVLHHSSKSEILIKHEIIQFANN